MVLKYILWLGRGGGFICLHMKKNVFTSADDCIVTGNYLYHFRYRNMHFRGRPWSWRAQVKKCNHTQMSVLMSLWNNLMKKDLTISYFCLSAFQRLGDMMWKRMIFHSARFTNSTFMTRMCGGTSNHGSSFIFNIPFSCPLCFLYFNVCFKNLQWLIHWSGCVYTVTHCFSFFHFFFKSVLL